jgi:hypothetical protein
MDLYGTSGNAIAQGNMRTQQVRDLNEKIRQHNQDVADKIQGLREQTKSADTIKEALDTGKTLWEGSKMPGAIKTYQDWKVGKIKGKNPVKAVNDALKSKAQENNPISNAMGENQSGDLAGEETRAEGSPSGASISEEASEVAEGEGNKLAKGLTGTIEAEVESGALSKLGKATGVIGGLSSAGIDLYQDFKGGKGFHLAGDNWEEKTGNALNLAGAVADIGGTFFPPLAIVGGALDLASAGIDAIGEKVSEDKESDDLKQKEQQETVQEVSAPVQQTITTGRVQ